jgi:hypothetical protein
MFYPATPAERDEAVAIHHTARSWQDAKGFQQATLRAEERLAAAQRELEKTQKKLRALEARVNGEHRSLLTRLRDRVAAKRA